MEETMNIKEEKYEIKEPKKGKILKDLFIDFIIVIVITALISFFVKPTVVKGESMLPTLENNNYLLTSAQAYKFGKPHRGDIVIFPHQEYDGQSRLYIKRVIAIPGDDLIIAQDKVYINGKLQKEEYINEKGLEGRVNMKIPEGEIFVMGDNRNNSSDSREFGTVKIAKVKGKAFIRLYPFSDIKVF